MGFKRKLPPAVRDERRRQLADARRDATVEVQDGREFRVVRLPDRYGQQGPVGGKLDRETALDSLPGETM
jgi:hypothetical protein